MPQAMVMAAVADAMAHPARAGVSSLRRRKRR
jgi:hypothetical protein